METAPRVIVRPAGFDPPEIDALLRELGCAGVAAEPASTSAPAPLLRDPRCALLIVAAAPADLPAVIAAIREARRTVPRYVPVLGLLRAGAFADDVLLAFDDVREPPFDARAICLAAKRLLLLERPEAAGAPPHEGCVEAQGLIARSPAMLRILQTLPRLAAADAPVLVRGETGTGKEVLARALHDMSPRAARPFVAVNCAAIEEEPFETEMFGGNACVDAAQQHGGLAAAARGGSLFLDEVDALPLSAQVKLLRFLQDGCVGPRGASRTAGARVMAATSRDLESRIARGEFRPDLLYRLNVITLELPPLRERREDILPLARAFVRRAALDYDRPVLALAPSAIHALLCHAWPGNVRELENVMRAAVVLAEGGAIEGSDLSVPAGRASVPRRTHTAFKIAKRQAVATFEYAYLTELLQACGGNITRAAREAGKQRRAFFALLKKYGLTHARSDAPEHARTSEVH